MEPIFSSVDVSEVPLCVPQSPNSVGPLSVEMTPAPYQSGLERVSLERLVPTVRARLQEMYPDHTVLPFHGINHPESVARDAERFVERAETQGIFVDQHALLVAALLHDIHYRANFNELGFSSREHLAGHRAYEILKKMGAPEEGARNVERIIYATDFRVAANTVEEKFMKAADLYNIADLYGDFAKNAKLLHKEQILLSGGRETPFSDFVVGSINYLSLYAFRELFVTPWSRLWPDGISAWHVAFRRNAAQLFLTEVGEGARLSVFAADYGREAEIFAVMQDPKALYVLEHQDEEYREQLLSQIFAARRCGDVQGAALVLPSTASSIPVPGSQSVEGCDR